MKYEICVENSREPHAIKIVEKIIVEMILIQNIVHRALISYS